MNSGRVAWIVGGSRGIGASIARMLAADGHRIALSARSTSALEAVGVSAREAGAPDVLIAPASVQSRGEIEGAVNRVVDRWGGINVLVNCAGISPVFVRSEALEEKQWTRIVDTNLTGTFRCCQAVFPTMRETGGSIVNISSIHGELAGPRLAAYAASKGGINALTRTLAVEWAPYGIRVNAVAPGYVSTAMTDGIRNSEHLRTSLLDRIPAGKFADADDVGAMVAFLAAPRSSYITGSILHVDGGWSAQ